MILLDANVILRYLLNDHEQMSAQAEKYIQEEDTCVTIEVAAENNTRDAGLAGKIKRFLMDKKDVLP